MARRSRTAPHHRVGRVVPLDLSAALRTPYLATSPALLASFVRINQGDQITLRPNATLWAMFGLLPAGKSQLPHRQQSVAVDLIVDCLPGCYSLLGDEVDPETCRIVDPVRIDWESGGAFVTPPGKWHSHHNESGRHAHLIPIQDAGLQTYLRALDIRFSDKG